MKPPIGGYGKEHAVKWLGIDGETMYSGAMTKAEAKRLVVSGHWHSKAAPVLIRLATKRKRAR